MATDGQGEKGRSFVAVPLASAGVGSIGPAMLYQMAFERAVADLRQRRQWLVAIAARDGKN